MYRLEGDREISRTYLIRLIWLMACASVSVFAQEGHASGGSSEGGTDFAAGLLSLVTIMVVAKLGAEVFERMQQAGGAW